MPFPTATRDDWRALVAAVLAKSGVQGDPEQALTSTTYDDIELRPLYTAEDAPSLSSRGRPGRPPYVRGACAERAGWDVRTRHGGPDAAATIRADLAAGATSVWLVGDAAFVPRALADVDLAQVPIALDAGAGTVAAARALLDLGGRGSFGADPIGLRARTGADADLGMLAELAALNAGLPLATVDATIYAEAGASDAQELGIGTAVGVAYLRALTDAGLAVADALAALEFRWTVGVEQFPSIAKLRAARRVWGRVAELCGAGPELRGQYQHAVTSGAVLTKRDPWVNLLRTTIGCFAAAVGGADAITVAPFDAAIGVSDDFARRIARNTHAILHDESSLARVIDPAGGSWYVEALTDRLAERAWDVFTRIEQVGGALAALNSGAIGELVAQTQARRADDVAHRRAPITGVSEYADVAEAPVPRPSLPAEAGGRLLPRVRYAAPFEELRDRADAAPRRPRVYLATLGPLTAHGTRAAFAANLFQAGGIECVTGPVAEFDGIAVACLCGSDKAYPDEAAAAAKALRDAGAVHVWLAGRGKYDGVDGNLYARCDALAVLRTTFDVLGVAP